MTAAAMLLKITLVLTLALIGTRLARRTRASVRHVLLSAAFAVLLALPIASAIVPATTVALPKSVRQLPAPVVEAFTEAPLTLTAPDAVAGVTAQAATSPLSWSDVAFTVWMCGVALFLVPVVLGLRQVRMLRRDGLPWRDGQRAVADLSLAIHLRSRVDVLLHESIPGPMTCGVIRPVILLPSDAVSWPAHELQSAIIHELEHVRRGDWISQCVARALAAAYWFHPMVWIAWRQLALEAERACDDAVLKHAEATTYADQLVVLAQRLSTSPRYPQLAMANRRDLAMRVRAVLDVAQHRGRAGGSLIAMAIAASAAIILTVAPIRVVSAYATGGAAEQANQAGARPKYDAATIKPCVAEENPTGARGTAGGTNASFSPGRFYVPCVTTEQLIYLAYAAYGARDDQHLVNDDLGTASNATKIRGGPAWVHSLRDKYQIEATAAGATDRAVLMGDMLQSLLEDRFHLKIHRETEEVPLLNLVVGKVGFKLKPMQPGDCTPYDDNNPPEMNPAKPTCGGLNMSGGNGITRWRWGGGTMSGLAGQLSRVLGVHIIDKTNIADQFVYTFEFSRGEDPQATETSVFAAVDEQLGLKLEKTKGPRGFIVIDAIERPAPDGPLVHLPARARGANVPPAEGTTSSHTDRAAMPHPSGGQAATFDVVSVKPCAPGASPGMRGGGAGGSGVSPGSISMSCHTPAYLIDLAYVYYADRGKDDPINAWIRRGQLEWVRGAPAWASTEQFMIEAKTSGATDRNVMLGSMLRAALEDRFKLKTHIETEQADMWTLTVGKGGPKFKAPVAGDCVALDGNRNPSREEFLANPNKPFCGKRIGITGETASSWGFSAQTMAVLADTLGPELGAKVIDQTGLTGAFTFMLRYEPGDNIAASIASALDQQLGLKLTRTKGTRGFIVIDHIERPRPN